VLERRASVTGAHFVKLYGGHGFTPKDPHQVTP
jgi:hypothetical protein